MTPAIDWSKFISEMGVTQELDTLLVMQPKYMKAMDAFLSNTSIGDIKTLMEWSTLNNAAGFLTTEIEKANWLVDSITPRESDKSPILPSRLGFYQS